MTHYTIKLVLQQCCTLHVCDVTWKQETNDPIYVTSGIMWTKDPIYVTSCIMWTKDPIYVTSGIMWTKDPIYGTSCIMWKRKCFYLFLYLITFETLEQSSLFLFLVLCHTCLLLWMFLVCFLGNLTKNTYNKECRCYQEHRFIINVFFLLKDKGTFLLLLCLYFLFLVLLLLMHVVFQRVQRANKGSTDCSCILCSHTKDEGWCNDVVFWKNWKQLVIG